MTWVNMCFLENNSLSFVCFVMLIQIGYNFDTYNLDRILLQIGCLACLDTTLDVVGVFRNDLD